MSAIDQSAPAPLQRSLPARPALSIAGDDLRWYGTSVSVALVGAVVQLLWHDARELGFGVVVLVLGLFVGLVRLLLQRQARAADQVVERLSDMERALDVAPPDSHRDPGLSSVAGDLWHAEQAAHRERLAAIKEGVLAVSGREQSVSFLRTLSERAVHSIHAVDLADVHEWLTSAGMVEYLGFQLGRCQRGEMSLERVRVVRESDLSDRRRREELRRFLEMHEAVGARIILCPIGELERLDTVFGAQGMAMMDRGHNDACVMGRIGTGGHLEGAVVYLRKSVALRRAAQDYDRVVQHVERSGLDTRLRAQLRM
jgi:hypothetical protein